MDKNELIAEAEAKVFLAFKEATADLARKCGAEYFAGRRGYAWVSDLFVDTKERANIEVWVDILGEPFQVRLCLDGPERLQVGWGCNNLLTTHLDHYNDVQIKAHDFVAEVFRHEAEWRAALLALDLKPVLTAKAEVRAREEAEAKAKYDREMAAFNGAGIKVGSVLVSGNHSYEVTRIFNDKLKVGKMIMKKVDIGRGIESGVWTVMS